MALTIEQKRARWNRLELCAYTAHNIAYPESYRGSRLNPKWGPEWHEKIEKRVNVLKRRMLEQEGSGAPRYAVSWGPHSRGSYGTELLITKGGVKLKLALEMDPEEMGPVTRKEVNNWEPLPSVRGDSEGGCGFLMCSKTDLPEVLRRLMVLEPGVEPSVHDQYEQSEFVVYNAPTEWGTSYGWTLFRGGGRVTLNTPEPVQDVPPGDMIAEIAKHLEGLERSELAVIYRDLLGSQREEW